MMVRRKFALGVGALLAFVALPAAAQKKGGAKDAQAELAERAVKQLVQAVRESRDADALKLFDLEGQAAFLLGDEWSKVTPALREEFITLFGRIFAAIAFPRGRDNLKDLDSIVYAPAEIRGEEARVKSTVFIKHPLKTQEMKCDYVVRKKKPGWRVFDLAVLGTSVLASIRDDQVRPAMQKGLEGMMTDLRAMDARFAAGKR